MMQGLQNLGATCAVNSLIQVLCRNKYTRDIILNSHCSNDSITSELKEIFDLMYNKNHSLSPKKFINILYKTFRHFFRFGEQIDICELWMILHDKISHEIGEQVVFIDYNVDINSIKIEKNIELCQSNELNHYCNKILHKINNNKVSYWHNISQGIFLYMIKCKCCQNILYNFEPFISISLDICENENLAAMFRTFLKPSTHKGDWKCEKCNDYTEYVKTIKIWKIPNILIFNIKRFSENLHKNNKEININESFYIKKGSIIKNLSSDKKYIFSSMALHYGNMNNGHYCAICKYNNEYFLYDDMNVNKVNNIFEKNKNAYMIIYEEEQFMEE